MLKDSSEKTEELELDPENYVTEEESFDYFNSDIRLLAIKILLESCAQGKTVFTLEQFLKGEYWKIDEISWELQDTGDYGSAEDLVMQQIISILETLNLGKVKRISVTHISELLQETVRDIMSMGTEDAANDDIVDHYTGVIEEIFNLKKLHEKRLKTEYAGQYPLMPKNGIDLDKYFQRQLSYISKIAAPFIEFEVSFIDERAKEIEKELETYINSFSQDEFIGDLSPYLDKRFYFSKQLSNFFDYISKLPHINGAINIPFSTLGDANFEIVKMLSYLEMKKLITVKRWNDVDVWNVTFHNAPITLESLTSNPSSMETEKLKTVLSFDEARSILRIGEFKIKLQKNSDQFHLFRIIFEDPSEISKEWFFSEIAEKYDISRNITDKKFYNAAYQVSQKIIRDTDFKDVLTTTSQSVQINPKYLS